MATLIDHLALPTPLSLLDAEVSFLAAALAPLGIKELFRVTPEVVALGPSPDKAYLWVAGIEDRLPIPDIPEGDAGRGRRVHVGFTAKDRAQVQAFHAAALKAGGKDNGAPGVRKDYHPGYYAAFVYSPAGHNVEVVLHEKAS